MKEEREQGRRRVTSPLPSIPGHEAIRAAYLDSVAVQQSTVAVLRGHDAGLERDRQHEVVLCLRQCFK